jgi:rhamnose utilization protein RhaD (predicted bifunctional aldolase and dehydrogenase)
MLNKLNPLKEVSQLISQNIDLVQGAGGNTTLKDGNVLWIKASGCWLSDATYKEIFMPVDRNNVLDSINNVNIKNIQGAKQAGIITFQKIEKTIKTP